MFPTIKLTGSVFPEEGRYVSHCNELNLMTCAETADGAMRRTADMISAFFAAAVKTGTFATVLRQLGVGAPPNDPNDLRITTDFKVQSEISLR